MLIQLAAAIKMHASHVKAELSGGRIAGRRAKVSAIYLQRGNKSFLRDVDLAELPHLLLAFLLLLQKFSFAGDVAAVALRGDVLAQRAHGLARDHLAADRRLDRDLEHVRR